MARHSFIQMSKLSNVKGRISYISDPKRQEYLYATFSTREDMTFWNDLAKECQTLRDRGKMYRGAGINHCSAGGIHEV